jgi:membrane fusion protein, multidrug efflux system
MPAGVTVLCAFALFALLAACGPVRGDGRPEIRPVRVVAVEKREGGDSVSLTGTVQAAEASMTTMQRILDVIERPISR